MNHLPEIAGVDDLVEIGRGGFGVVYRGTEVEFGRDVAVKVLMPSLDERTRRRFERERRAMGAVSDHPNIVTVYRGGLTPSSQPYLVMEYLRGGSLSDRLHTVGPIDWRAAATIGAKLADALTVAHRAGILHRDVKPGNVFLTGTGEPKLGDFGIARLDDGQDSRTGSITASVAHAPPEIVDGERGDERSDLYSLASTVYALTIGFAPFSQDADQGLARLLARIAHDDPPPLHLESSARDFETALFRALSKRPEDRQATVAELGIELRRAAQAPITQPIVAAPEPSPTASATAAPVLVGSQSQPVLATAAAATRSIGPSQIAGFALLALLIAGFGGWAVARAVFDNDSTDIATTTSPIATAIVDPTAIVPTQVPATATPPTPQPQPSPTASATAAPEVTPTPELTGGQRGTSLGNSTQAGYTRVTDVTGAISVDVPDEWTETIEDSFEVPADGDDVAASVLAVGATFLELSGDVNFRDLSTSGIYVFAARLDAEVEGGSTGLLDGSVEFWSDCEQGERSQILLDQGNAAFQLLACDYGGDDRAGVVVLTLVPRDDPDVGVSVFLQFAAMDDLDSLETVLGSLSIDTSKLPAPVSDP